MAMFMKLAICLALLTLTSLASGSKCKRKKHQFVSKCLKQGYQPEILENCELSGEARKPMNKCKRMEKEVVVAKCGYECYAPPATVVGRAVFIPDAASIARGLITLHCSGTGDKIFWDKNGMRLDTSVEIDDGAGEMMHIYTVKSTQEAHYSCAGVGLYLLIDREPAETREASVWQNSSVVCIDKIANEETKVLARTDGAETTTIYVHYFHLLPIYPVKERKVAADMTVQCNNTEAYTFVAKTRPVTNVEFKGNRVICTSTGTKGRCNLKIYFRDEEVASGPAPVLKHSYGNIEIPVRQVRCTADCERILT